MDAVTAAGGADQEDTRIPRQRFHRWPARAVLQAQQVRVSFQRRPAAGRGVADELRATRRPLSAARRRHHRLCFAHVRRARRLQVASALLAPQAQQELLEESVDDVLEPGTQTPNTTTNNIKDRQPLSTPISRKRCEILGKLLLITCSMWHTSYQLLPKLVDLEWPWTAQWPLFCNKILRNNV